MNIRGGDRVMHLIRDSKMKVAALAIDVDDEIVSISFHGCELSVERVVGDSGEVWRICGVDDDGNDYVVTNDSLIKRIEVARLESEKLVRRVNVLRDETITITKMMALVKAV